MARVRPSPTSATLALAARLRAQGRDIISLGAGEPDFDTPQAIKDAAIAAIRAGDTKYTPIEGTLELRQAVQRKFRDENGLDYDVSQIVISAGAKQAIFNLCMGLLDAGDEVVIPAPYWVSYPDIAALADATPVVIPTGIDQDFKVTPAQLTGALNDRSRLLIFNSPSNPTGASYTRAEIEALGAVLEDYPRVIIASDEIYEHIQWADEAFVSFAAACPGLRDRVVTINGVSKAYAMTGWRIGYAAGPVELVGAMTTIQSQCTSNPCSVSQAAAIAALTGDQAVVLEMTAAYRKRHDFIVPALNAIPGIECRPGEGSFYAFPRIKNAMRRLGLDSDADFAAHVLNQADVAIVPGSAFGAPGYVRLSFACSMATLEEAVNRIERTVAA